MKPLRLKYKFEKELSTSYLSHHVLLEYDIPEFEDMDSVECVIFTNHDVPDAFWMESPGISGIWYYSGSAQSPNTCITSIGSFKFEDGYLSAKFYLPDLKYNTMYVYYRSKRLERDEKLKQLCQ